MVERRSRLASYIPPVARCRPQEASLGRARSLVCGVGRDADRSGLLSEKVNGRYGPLKAFEGERSDWLDPNGVLNGSVCPRTEEDLSALRLVTEPRGHVDDAAHG